MPKELDQDTLEALRQQGGIGDDDATNHKQGDTKDDDASKNDLPDIDITDPDKNKDDSDDKPGDASDDKPGDDSGDKDDNKDADDSKVLKTLEDAGYSSEALQERLKKDGGISDEFVKELKEKIDPDLVDAHVGRLRAEIELRKKEVADKQAALQKQAKAIDDMNNYIFDSVGGEDKFKIMGKALKESLSADEVAVINAKLASGNKTVVKEGLEAAVKQYNTLRGMGGKLMEGDAGQGGEPQVHLTKAEYRALMRSDKYKSDPVYARTIDEARLKTREQDSNRYGQGAYYGFHPSKGRYAL